jgi:hypothetical protein
MVEEKDKKSAGKFRDAAFAAAGSSFGAAVMAAVLLGVDASSDPLRDAVQNHKIQNIQPEQLADEISKDPAKQARWRELREFVAKIDKGVQWNIAQDSKNLAHTAENWQERTDPPNLDTSKRPAR